MSASAMLHCDT